MNNRNLQKAAESVSGIIDRLIAEIECLETELSTANEKIGELEKSLGSATQEIFELLEEIKNLKPTPFQ